MTPLKHTTRLIGTAVLVAWLFDLLFWKQEPGINFLILVAAALGGGFALLLGEGHRPAPLSLVLAAGALFFSVLTLFRREPFSVVIGVLLTLGLLFCLAVTLRSGLWLRYRLVDWIKSGFSLLGSVLIGGIDLLTARQANPAADETAPGKKSGRFTRVILVPVLVGLVLALPVLFVLGSLLSQADPAFSELLQNLLSFLDIEYLAEYLTRAAYIALIAYLLMGVYLYSLNKSQTEAGGAEKTWLKPFLGAIEAVVVLALVDVLFALFVGVQMRYFFGGQNNITVAGFTYAEYARRGFNEMFWVVFLSLLLFVGLSTITRRQTPARRRAYSAAGLLLVGLVAVILVSAFQRLLLYEAAYGFTRIRTYTHVFMLWVGALLLITMILDLKQRLGAFAAALLLVAIGFGATLNLLNVDAFIARQNIARARAGQPLDAPYLLSLSDDAIPLLAAQYRQADLPAGLRADLGGVLACKLYWQEQSPQKSWRSFHPGTSRAAAALQRLKPELEPYFISQVEGQAPTVRLGGEETSCLAYTFD